MQFVHSYLALLSEAYQDIVNLFESEAMRGFVLASLVLIPVFGSLFFFAVLVNAAEPTPTSESSTITIAQTDVVTLEILLTDNAIALNAAEVEVLFDAAHFTIADLAISESLCDERFVITKEIDNEAGRVFYQCGTVSPFSGTSTTLAMLTISPAKAGTSTALLGEQTNVLAHDGFGTNVTGARVEATIATAS